VLPPHPFPLHELSGDVRNPDLEDLKRVLDLRHLVRCVEQMYRERDPSLSSERRNLGEVWSDHEDWATMRDRFHISMYRVLLAGAVLTRPYLEPWFLAPAEGPPDLLHRCQRPDLESGEIPMFAEDVEYLERFPAYRLEASVDEWEPVFGDLAQWLVDDVKNTATPLKFEPPRVSRAPRVRRPLDHLTPDDRGCLEEVLAFLAAYEHMIDKFFNEYIKDASDEEMDESLLVVPPFPGDVRDVSTAMFGLFRPEKVSIPAKVEDASRSFLVNFPLGHYPRDNSVLPEVSPWNTDVRSLLIWMQARSGRPNRRNDNPSPPPWLRFVEFVMRKFFHVGFKDNLFDEENRYHMENYKLELLSCPDLFGPNFLRYWNVESAVLARYQTPALSYLRPIY
jgi:hypothetical protein